jgi:hypothetical protein
MTIGAAADERIATGIQGEIRTSAVACKDRQVSVKTAAGNRHSVAREFGGTAGNCIVHQPEPAWNWLSIADNDAVRHALPGNKPEKSIWGCVDGDRSAVRCLSR